MYLPYQKFIEYTLLDLIRSDRRFLKNKKGWQSHFKQRAYYASELNKILLSENLYIYFTEEELLAFCKQFCTTMEKIPRKVIKPDNLAYWITFQPRIRKTIEVLSILKYPLCEILDILKNNHLVNNTCDLVYLKDYLTFFFNIEEMCRVDLDMFFAKVRTEQISYYRIHIGVYFGTIDEETALASLGLELDGVNDYNIPNRLGRLIKILCVKMDKALIEDDLSKVQALSQGISSLANSFSRLGGEQEQKSHSLSDYVKLMVVPREETLTVEEMREHNARIEAERIAQQNAEIIEGYNG